MFVVPKDTPGFTVGKEEKKLGIHGSDTRELVFEDCFVPKENLIGCPGEGFKGLMKHFNYTRPGAAAQTLGIAQGAMDAVVDYTKDRVQFGKPLAEFQGFQWMMAEMALKIELARTMVEKAWVTIDNDPESRDIPRLASMAKWFASDTAMDGGDHRCGSDLWWIWIFEGISSGANDEGCKDHLNLRGNKPGSAHYYGQSIVEIG